MYIIFHLNCFFVKCIRQYNSLYNKHTVFFFILLDLEFISVNQTLILLIYIEFMIVLNCIHIDEIVCARMQGRI